MKMLSLILKVVALLAAAFCIFAWFDVKGRISTAETQMAEINGATLVEKAPNAAQINKENNQRKIKIAAFEKRVKSLEQEVSSKNSELESERSKNLSAQAEIVKGNREIRALKGKIEASSKQMQEKDATIESLKQELLSAKEMQAKQDDTDTLKDKISALESKLAETQKQLADANEKAKIASMAEVVEVIDTDASGKKIKRKIVKVPYVPKGDIATVIYADAENGVITINKGAEDGLKASQVLLLKKEGVVIAQAQVEDVAADMASLVLNKNVAIPEYVTEKAQFELASPALEAKPAEQQETE